MAWSLPAKTGCRTKVSTRSMMVDSRGMTIPPVMINNVELSDVRSIAFASRIPKRPVASDRDAATSAPPRGRLTAVRPNRRARDESDGPGPPGAKLVLADPIRRLVGAAAPSRPSPGESPAGRGYNVTPGSTIL
jgi:hypothetical protein